MITFVLLFQPWLTTGTGGTDGVIQVNAFGRIHVTTFWVDLWAQTSVPNPRASGTWGMGLPRVWLTRGFGLSGRDCGPVYCLKLDRGEP
ncbi:hypothetical protein, partial [Nocardia sp. NPDC004750]